MKKAVLSSLAHFAPQRSLEAIVAILEQEHSVNFERLAEDIGILRIALTKMFGNGESVVEARISKALAKDVGVEFEGKSLDEIISLFRAANDAVATTH
ncbi:MAG: hypothetical protein JRN15_05515 [Nitrososphaerota archaeon]|nr:hypothetical protein [Nitrososphaerota archaeon]